ncbi:aldo/keto reductase [Streptomyces toyocaensis]|uniref:Aldo/keto reductase n=1 Tax=Streptomyces toyocaensis TaxID=55952 RepID=A0A081XR43_STRTO|nr:aldo/keto reductase [Streptomyces toyocaensis]KES06016.1 aldo/keto reductase [Streptomyces toyocaensis]
MNSAEAAGARKLGDLEVNRVGYGAMRLTGNGMMGNSDGTPIDRDLAVGLLHSAFEQGVNHIDTAAFYFSPLRSANELINRALSSWHGEVVVVTKVGPARDSSGEWLTMARPDQLRGQVEENLRQLGRDHLDVVNLRCNGPGTASVIEHFGALTELCKAGLIRHLGLSNVRPEHVVEALTVAPVVCVQNSYGLDWRRADETGLVDLCQEQGIAFVPYFAVSGLRREAAAGRERDARVHSVARAHGATPAQVRIAWTLHRGPHVLAIPGTTNPAHLAENIAAGSLRLTEHELALLDEPDESAVRAPTAGTRCEVAGVSHRPDRGAE